MTYFRKAGVLKRLLEPGHGDDWLVDFFQPDPADERTGTTNSVAGRPHQRPIDGNQGTPPLCCHLCHLCAIYAIYVPSM